VGLVGKYMSLQDSYKSVVESLLHAGIALRKKIKIHYIDSEEITEATVAAQLAPLQGLIVPGGFGARGIDGKILAIQFAREKGIPFLGICLGMQLAAIEFARNVLGLKEATSGEFHPESKEKIIALLADQKHVTTKGATMRLGSFPCEISPETKASKAYQKSLIEERHRHRYEFNADYYERFKAAGVVFSGHSPTKDLVEILEVVDHPWFVGCQFHPELKSKPTAPHPLFLELVRHAISKRL